MDTSHRCCNKQKVKKGFWSPEEDEKLITHITTHGHSSWSSVPRLAGLERCGKSCRLRWVNYLRPNLKKGIFTPEEEQIIIDVHRIIGNKWAQIAKHLPGRTDNEVKNFWNSCIKKKLISLGLDPNTHNLISSTHHQMTSKASNFMIDFMKFKKTRNYQEEEEEEPNSVFSVVPDNINPHVMSRVLNSTSTDSAEIIMSPTTSLPDHSQLVLNNNIMNLQNQYSPVSCEYFPNYPLEMDSLPNIFSDQFPSSCSRVSNLDEINYMCTGTTTINPFETNTFLLEKSTQQLQNTNIGRDDEMLWDKMINIDKFVEEDSSCTMLQSQQHQDIAVFYDYQTFDQF